MTLWQRLLGRIEPKSDARPGETLVVRPDEAVWTASSYEAFAREGYRRNPYVFRAIRVIAQAVAGIPVLLYERAEDGVREVYDHPALDLLRNPNPLDRSYATAMEAFISTLMLSGEAYMLRLPERGRPSELWLLRPDYVRVYRDDQGMPTRYDYDAGRGRTVRYSADQVLHVRFWNPLDPVRGLAPLEAAARSVDQNNAGRAWNTAMLQNGGVPAGVLQASGNLSEQQRAALREAFRRRHAGPSGAGNVLLLEGDLSYQPVGLDAHDLSWLEGLKLSAREIAIAYGVPPELLGDSENKTYSNYQEARRAFYTETVMPLAGRVLQELSEFVAQRFSPGLFYAYDRDGIEALSEDRNAVWDRVLRALERSMLTVNEAREAVGYTPLQGGDVRLVSASILPVAAAEESATGTKAAFPRPPSTAQTWRHVDREREGYQRALERQVLRTLSADYRAIEQAVRQGGDWEAALREREGRWMRVLGAAHYAVAEAFGQRTYDQLTGKSSKSALLRNAIYHRVASWLATEGLRRVRGILETTRQRVARSLAEGVENGESIPDLAQRVRGDFSAAGPARAVRIARTEVVGASNLGAHVGAEESGLPLDKIWIATADGRTREDHAEADGQRVRLDEAFSVGGYPMRYPGDSSMGAPASEVVNCRCAVAFRPRENGA